MASRRIYESRINGAMDFVEMNLSERLTLAEVAEAASFSPFHFHRIFSAVVGETPGEHVRRVRIERSAALLVDQPQRSISAVAADCGFGTPSAFARTFRATYGVTPGQWRSSDGRPRSHAQPALRRFPSSARIERSGFRHWTLAGVGMPRASISVQHFGSVDLAYLRHTGPFQGSAELFEKLFARLDQLVPMGGAGAASADRYALYHDDPELTNEDRLRVSVAIPIGEGCRLEPPVGRVTLAAGLRAVARFDLCAQDYGTAWRAVLGGWLPASGYEPSQSPYFERFEPSAKAPDPTRSVEICIPVRPLSTSCSGGADR